MTKRIFTFFYKLFFFALYSGFLMACVVENPAEATKATEVTTQNEMSLDLSTQEPVPTVANEQESIVAQGDHLQIDINILIVYEKSGNLWITKSGKNSQLTNGGNDSRPKISDDGELVAFLRKNELWVVSLTGKEQKRIFGSADELPLQFDFEAHTHRIFFSTAKPDGEPRQNLMVADLDRGGIQTLLLAGMAGEFTPSTDWKILTLFQSGRILTYDISTGNVQLAFQFEHFKLEDGRYTSDISWMDNNFGFKTVIPGDGGNKSRLFFIFGSGGEPALLAEFQGNNLSEDNSFISPDGTRVLYLKRYGDRDEIHVVDISTADKTYKAGERNKIGILGWAPNSKKWIYWVEQKPNVLITDGVSDQPLSDMPMTENIKWINENSILFLNGSDLRFVIIGSKSFLIDREVTGIPEFLLLR